MDFLITPLGWKNWLLLISALINLIMAIFVFSRGVRRSKINLYFSFLAFSCFLWALGLFLSRLDVAMFWTSIFARSTYISALLIILSLFYFTIYFPVSFYAPKRLFSIVTFLFFLFLSILSYSDLFITGFIDAYGPGEYISLFNIYGFVLYALYFVVLAMLSLYNLLKKYKNLDGELKNNLLLLLVTISIGLIFGFYFDLFLEYFKNFKFNWFGPVFTIPMNMVVFYLVVFNKDR